MNMKQLIDAFVKYAEESLFPKLNELGRDAFYIAMGCLLDRDDLEDKCRMLGIVRRDGTVNKDRLKAGLSFALRKKGKPFDIGGFTFSQDDMDRFFSSLGDAVETNAV